MGDQTETTVKLRVERFIVLAEHDGSWVKIRGRVSDDTAYEPGSARRYWILTTELPNGGRAETGRTFADHDHAITVAQQEAGRLLDAWEPVSPLMAAYERAVDAFRVGE